MSVGDKPLEVNVEPEGKQLAFSEEGMVRLFIDIGRRHHINPGDIVGAIANEADIPGKAIGAIDVYDRFTLVDVPAEFVDQVLEKMQRSRIRKQNMNVRLASSEDVDASREAGRDRDARFGDRPAKNRKDFKPWKTKGKESKKPFPKRKKRKN